MKNKKTAGNYQSSILLCQPSCGYYFSSGLVVSETIYSSAVHGPIYNAASRVIIDGGRKVLQTAAIGGMLAQNFTLPAYAGNSSGVLVSSGQSIVSAGDTWTSTTVNFSGALVVSSGGTANSTTVNSAGILSVESGGSATNIIQHSGGQLWFDIVSGDTTYITGINERGSSFSVINGVASNVIVNNKGVYVHDGGILYNYIATSNGDFPIGAGGSGINVIQETGGDVSVDVGTGYDDKDDYIGTTYVTGTNQYGQSFSLISGVASNFVINEHGYLDIYSGGKAYGTIINSGYSGDKEEPGMTVYSGGSAISTVVKSGGSQLIEEGGYAIYTTVSSGGKQTVESGGTASNTVINENGQQIISSGGLSVSATINSGGSQHIESAGVASDTTINVGGWQYISAGGSAVNNIVGSGGSMVVQSGGVVSNTVVELGGSQIVSSGGETSGMIISGTQYVSSGAVDISAIILSNGRQHILNSGIASGTEIQEGGWQYVSSGGSAVNIVINSGTLYGWYWGGETVVLSGGSVNSAEVYGVLSVSSGGSATNVIQHSGGHLYFDIVSGDTTYITGINERGSSFSLINGVASNVIVNGKGVYVHDGGILYNYIAASNWGESPFGAGGSAINVIQEIGGDLSVDVGTGYGGKFDEYIGTTYITGTNQYGQNFSLISGVASNFVVNEYGYLDIYSGGKAYGTIVNSGGEQYIFSGGTASNTIINENGSQVISSGGLSVSATINSGGKQYIESAGVASDTTINVGGWQYVSAGGSAVNNIVGSGGSMVVYNSGVVSNTVVELGGSQIVSSGGETSGMIISGTQYVSSGAVDISAIILSNGRQHILNSGIASGTEIQEGGWQYVSSGGSAVNIVINGTLGWYWGGETVVLSGGSVNSAEVYGTLSVRSGGSATNVIQHSGGQLCFDIVSGDSTYITGINERGSSFSVINGVASNVIVNNKGVYVHDGGILYNYIATSNGDFPIGAGGSGINVIQETGGDVSVDVGSGYGDKGEYIGTTYITGTNQYGQSFSLIGGVASNFVINEHGYLDIYSGGKAYGTIINSGYSGDKEEPGMTVHSGGSAISTTVNSGGSQLIEYGGYAIYTTVSSGGKQTVESGGTAISNFILSGAIQNIENGAIVENAVISGGGSNSSSVSIQIVSSGAIASNTSIGANAVQQINDGGLAISAVISSGGEQNILSGGGALGTVIYNGGTQKIGSSGYASGTVISQGGAMELASGGFAAGLTVSSGGTARISGTNTLFSDNELQNGGSISLVRTDVSAPAVLTFENLYGNGTIDMGIDFSNPAESDKIVISGIHNGNTVLNIKTIKGGKPVNDDSLKIVDCSGATGTGTFSLKGGKLDTGWYEYTLDRDIQDYYLRSNGEMTNVAKTAIAAPAMGNVSINVALNSLQKRLGDLRNMGNGSAQHGTWARGYYQSLTLKEKIETEMKISGIETGYDFRLSEEGSYNGEGTYLGIMAGKSSVSGIEGKGRTGRQESKGEGEGVLGGAYLTYIGESGFFADFTARAGTNKLDLSAYSESEGGWLQFSPERTFIAASMEAGKSFGGSAWKIEPKAEMRYMNIGGADAEVKGQPEKIKFGGASYITAIGTLNAAYSWKRADGMITQPYAEVSYSQELSGEEEIKYSGNMDKSSMKGGFIEGRIGINMQMSDNLYWHAAASMESGSRREGFGADAGIRYMFGGHKQAKRQTDNYWKDKIGTKSVSAEKKADDKAITALPAKPATVLLKAVNAEPGNNIVTTEKEEYLAKAGRAEKTISKEVLKIPPMGLLFQIGKMAILSYYTPMLDAFARLYLLTDQSSIIYVEGFSSNGGNETKNNPNLSKERAMNVAYYLMSKGIKGNKILVKPYGNSKIGSGMFANDAGCKGGQCYRRVNISIK